MFQSTSLLHSWKGVFQIGLSWLTKEPELISLKRPYNWTQLCIICKKDFDILSDSGEYLKTNIGVHYLRARNTISVHFEQKKYVGRSALFNKHKWQSLNECNCIGVLFKWSFCVKLSPKGQNWQKSPLKHIYTVSRFWPFKNKFLWIGWYMLTLFKSMKNLLPISLKRVGLSQTQSSFLWVSKCKPKASFQREKGSKPLQN